MSKSCARFIMYGSIIPNYESLSAVYSGDVIQKRLAIDKYVSLIQLSDLAYFRPGFAPTT